MGLHNEEMIVNFTSLVFDSTKGNFTRLYNFPEQG